MICSQKKIYSKKIQQQKQYFNPYYLKKSESLL